MVEDHGGRWRKASMLSSCDDDDRRGKEGGEGVRAGVCLWAGGWRWARERIRWAIDRGGTGQRRERWAGVREARGRGGFSFSFVL
jgi:hypothetical protein